MPYGISVTGSLQELQQILENLPTSLPEPAATDSRFGHFIGFVPDPDDVEDIGTVEGAVNRALEVAFGADARSKGILSINERGPGICGLIDALRVYKNACVNPESDAILLKWIEDIRAGAEAVYKQADKQVRRSLLMCTLESGWGLIVYPHLVSSTWQKLWSLFSPCLGGSS